MIKNKSDSHKQSYNKRKTAKRCCKKLLQSNDIENQCEHPVFKTQKEEYRYYCTNPKLLVEMFKWRNSCDPKYNKKLSIKDGLIIDHRENKDFIITPTLKIKKLVNGKFVPTQTYYTKPNDFEYKLQNHEPYKRGVKYFIKYSKNHKRYTDQHYLDKIDKSKKDKFQFYRETPTYVIEDVTHYVKDDGFTFDIDIPQERIFSDNFAKMVELISQKVSNHSFFRNYSPDDKLDMMSYAWEKIFRGLWNYKLKYQNVFAYITQACFNSYKSILSAYYKQINIKRSITKRQMIDIEGQIPGSSINKCLGNQFANNDYDDFSSF